MGDGTNRKKILNAHSCFLVDLKTYGHRHYGCHINLNEVGTPCNLIGLSHMFGFPSVANLKLGKFDRF